MKCRDVKSNLSLYCDDVLTADERGDVDAHLVSCPLCRQRHADLQDLRNGLRSLSRPRFSVDSLASLRSAVAAQLVPAMPSPAFHLLEDRRTWSQAWMMPSAVGAFASLIIGVSLLWAILFTAPNAGIFEAASKSNGKSGSSILLARSGPDILDLSPSEYANTRLAISGESPSINPQGALVALTRSLVRGKINDEEVVVVADVFGNGLARIAEVVETSGTSREMIELENALQSDPSYAPFVPASFDQRSEVTRVILKIQSVNVSTRIKRPRRARSQL